MSRRLVVAMMALMLCQARAAIAQDVLSYSGSSTIGMSVLEAGALKALEAKTGKKFVSVEQPGSGKGMKALIERKVTIGGASRALTPEEKKAGVLGHIIGYDGIAVFVNKANPIKNLTKDQIKGISTGRIKNWKEVGGDDAPIAVNTEILGEKRATMLVFQELAMDNAAYGTGFKETDLPRDQIVETAKSANSICSVSFGLLAAVPADLQGKVKMISVNGIDPMDRNIRSGAYLISRPLVLGTMGLPKGAVKEFINFMLSKEGQEIVSKNFVPVRR